MCPVGSKANSSLHEDQFRGGKHFENTAVRTKLPFKKHQPKEPLLGSCHYNHFEQFCRQKSWWQKCHLLKIGDETFHSSLDCGYSVIYLLILRRSRGVTQTSFEILIFF